MNPEDDQELWDLLGQAPQPRVSPFFARNVIRQIRQTKGWRETVARWFGVRTLVPASVVAVALTSAVIFLPRTTSVIALDDPPEMLASIDPQDYEVVVDLDDLLANEDDNLWTDNDSLSL